MSRLGDIAAALRDAVTAAFADSEWPPDVAYIADGNITMEFGPERPAGPQSAIVVTWDRNVPGAPSGTADGYIMDGYFTTGVFSVYVLRPAPMPVSAQDAVATEDAEEAALVMLDDASRVLSAVINGYASSEIGGICGAATIVAHTPVGPEGGVEGSRLQVAVQLI